MHSVIDFIPACVGVFNAYKSDLGRGGPSGIKRQVSGTEQSLKQTLVQLNATQIFNPNALLVARNQAIVTGYSGAVHGEFPAIAPKNHQIGRASCRESV